MSAWRVGRIGRTEVLLHPASLLFAGYLLCLGHGMALLCGMLSILVHEAAHGACAALLGYPPQRVEVTPLGALLRLDDEGTMPSLCRIVMLAAGPAASFLLCMAALDFTRRQWLPVIWGRCLFLSNLAILAVNLLPALPLDGGRLASVLLGCFVRRATVRQVMRVSGKVVGVLLVAANVWASLERGGLNLSLSFAGCFLLYAADAATISAHFAELTDAMSRRHRLEKRQAVPGSLLVVSDACPLALAVRSLPASRLACVAVMDADSQALLSIIGEQTLIQAWLADPEGKCEHLTCTNRTNAVQK